MKKFAKMLKLFKTGYSQMRTFCVVRRGWQIYGYKFASISILLLLFWD